MKRRIKITESQLKGIVMESVKRLMNEKSDFVTKKTTTIAHNDWGDETPISCYTVNRNHPDFSEENFDKRIKDDYDKFVERRYKNYEEPHETPEERLKDPEVRKRLKIAKEKRNQLLLPFGSEEKASNKNKESLNKTKKK